VVVKLWAVRIAPSGFSAGRLKTSNRNIDFLTAHRLLRCSSVLHDLLSKMRTFEDLRLGGAGVHDILSRWTLDLHAVRWASCNRAQRDVEEHCILVAKRGRSDDSRVFEGPAVRRVLLPCVQALPVWGVHKEERILIHDSLQDLGRNVHVDRFLEGLPEILGRGLQSLSGARAARKGAAQGLSAPGADHRHRVCVCVCICRGWGGIGRGKSTRRQQFLTQHSTTLIDILIDVYSESSCIPR